MKSNEMKTRGLIWSTVIGGFNGDDPIGGGDPCGGSFHRNTKDRSPLDIRLMKILKLTFQL